MERVWMLVLLPLCSGHSHYQGTVMTYSPLQTHSDGSVTVEVRYKSNSKTCVVNGYLAPPEGYHTVSHVTDVIDDSTPGFCQIEAIWIRRGPSNAPILMRIKSGHKWSGPTVNHVDMAQSSTLIELRRRSDTGKVNTSPQTTIPPVLRVPCNCDRHVPLSNFDPDGDLVRCRFASDLIDPTECVQCSRPAVLRLSPRCTLFLSGTGCGAQGLYAVQLMMEDFPRTDLTLTLSSGEQEHRGPSHALSKVALQFLLSVEAPAPSCSLGQDLPRFVEPTPRAGAHISTAVGLTVHVCVQAEVSPPSTTLELMFSGPSRITKTDVPGQRSFVLSWTPQATEDGQSHAVCFSVQTQTSAPSFSSEMRCVFVHVGFEVPETLTVFPKARITSSARLADRAVLALLLEQLEEHLRPQNVSVRQLSVAPTKR